MVFAFCDVVVLTVASANKRFQNKTHTCVCSRCARRNGKQMFLLLLLSFLFRGLFFIFYDERKMCTIIDDCLCLDEISLQTRFTLSHTEYFVVQPIKIFEYNEANQK